jgi:hypothetical protein
MWPDKTAAEWSAKNFNRRSWMEVNGFWAVFVLGCLGGSLLEVLRWWQLRERQQLPIYARSVRYWAITVVMILLGGGVATLYGIESQNAIALVNLGASAPALIGAFSKPFSHHVSDNDNPFGATRSGRQRARNGHNTAHAIRTFLSFDAS